MKLKFEYRVSTKLSSWNYDFRDYIEMNDRILIAIIYASDRDSSSLPQGGYQYLPLRVSI